MKNFKFLTVFFCAALLLTACAREAERESAETAAWESSEESGKAGEIDISDSLGAETAGEEEAGEEIEEESQTAGEDLASLKEYVIEDQSFQTDLDGWGEVSFISAAPDGDGRRDVAFYLAKDDRIVYRFPAPDSEGFRRVLSIAFRDFNEDGKKDVIALIEREQEDGGTCNACIVYQQESEAVSRSMETELMEAHRETEKSEDGPSFFRDTLLEEYMAEGNRADSIETVMDSWHGYMRYVRSLCLTEEMPDVFPLTLAFSSGAGAWSTIMTIYPDGSFDGFFSDSDMGDIGEGYPGGKRYICGFDGEFGDIVKLNEYSYSIRLKSLEKEQEKGQEWLEDEVLYITAEAYGIEGGEEFIFYTPDTPLEGLPEEEFLSWRQAFYQPGESEPDTLDCYGLFNVEQGQGFFTYG